MSDTSSSYVINTKLPLFVRARDLTLTLMVWGLYLYFMRGFFTFLSDLSGWVGDGFTNAELYPTLNDASTFGVYGLIIVGLAAGFIGWSIYNLLRFGSKNRRRFPAPVSMEELVIAYHHKPRDIAAWQHSRIMVMHHDHAARLTGVDIIRKGVQEKAAYGS